MITRSDLLSCSDDALTTRHVKVLQVQSQSATVVNIKRFKWHSTWTIFQ